MTQDYIINFNTRTITLFSTNQFYHTFNLVRKKYEGWNQDRLERFRFVDISGKYEYSAYIHRNYIDKYLSQVLDYLKFKS